MERILRTGDLQEILDRADEQARGWYAAADRAEIRNEPALAIYFRNQGWCIANGRQWLDDITIKS